MLSKGIMCEYTAYCNVEVIVNLHITPHVCTFEKARPFLFCSYKRHWKKYTAALGTLTVNTWSANSFSG